MVGEVVTMTLHGLDFLIEQRYSVRNFADTPVEKEKILQCVNAARLAPSARNNQPWRYIIVTEPAKRLEVAKAIHVPGETVNQFVYKTPVFIVPVYENIEKPVLPNRLPHSYYYDLDHGIAIGYLSLKAVELGLGTCIIGNFYDMGKLKQTLALPEDAVVKLVLALGYSERAVAPPKNRKLLEDILTWQ